MVSHELYPFPSRYIEVGGHRVHYVDEGKGEAIVCVHGNPTWSFFYRDVLAGLRDAYRVVAMDHLGMGLSARPDESRYSYRLEQRVDDLEQVLEQLGLRENVTLVLHDWGGMIGMAWASRHPERVKRLIVLNTAAFRKPADKKIPWQIGIIRNTIWGSLLVRGLNAFVQGLVRYCTVRPLAGPVRQGYLAPYRSWKDRLAILRFIQDIPLMEKDPSYQLVHTVEEQLVRFRDVPMLLCWGRRDFVFDDDYLAEWMRRFPKAECHVFEGAGHLVLEDAGERILALIRDFLRRYPVPLVRS